MKYEEADLREIVISIHKSCWIIMKLQFMTAALLGFILGMGSALLVTKL